MEKHVEYARILFIRCGLKDALEYRDERQEQHILPVNEVEWVLNSISPDFREHLEWIPVRAAKEEPFPALEQISGVIIGGSSYMLSTGSALWVLRVQELIRQAAASRIPLLGICLGHQLIAQTFGSRITMQKPREFGKVMVTLSEAGQQDKLFHGINTRFAVFMAHQEVVVDPGTEIEALAHNEHNPYQAIRVGDHIRGVQFHPEFSQEVMEAIWYASHPEMAAESFDIEQIKHKLSRPPHGKRVLENFLRYFVLS